MLAAGALVASLFAVGAAPAAAIDADSEQDHTTKKTACLGAATADAGFTDIAGLGAEAAINCLAYYKITTGKTADTFDPNSDVTRSQMALFLSRAAKIMGVDLMGGDMSADFGDIADQSEDRQAAITSLARNGILAGRGDMAFHPDAAITRAEMAVALVALLDKTPGVGLSRATSGANQGLYVFGMTPGTGTPPNDSFSDAYAAVSQPVNNAISAAYELGVTTGKSLDVFDPHGTVPRKNMASFITRALNHSNVRPAGLSAQLVEGEIIVSVRDSNFAPVLNAPVDAFYADAANESRAFKADGTCSSRTTAVEGNSKCVIGGSDPITQSGGNVTLASVDPGEGKTVWIWTGAAGDKVGTGTDLFELSVPKGAAQAVTAVRAAVSNDLPKDPNIPANDVDRARFGRTVTVTIQLKGANADVDKDAKPAATDDDIKYTVVTSTRTATVGDDGTATVGDAISQNTQTVTVDGDGKATFTVTVPDPDPRPGMSNTLAGRYVISIAPGADGTPSHNYGFGTDGTVATSTGDIIFRDAAPVVSYVSIENPGPQVAPGPNAPAAGTAVTITVRDQYGDPFRGAPVYLHTSNANTGQGDTDGGSAIASRVFTTGSAGTVRITYTYTGGAYSETLRATWDNTPADDDDVVTDSLTPAATGHVVGETTVLWVLASTLGSQTAIDVLSLDAANGQIVVDTDTGAGVSPTSVNFDSNDFFIVTAADGPDEGTDPDVSYHSMADFVAALTKELATAKATPGADQPTLAWAGYVYDDSSNITSFTLTLGGGR